MMVHLPTLLPFRALGRGLAAALLLLFGTAHAVPAPSAGACADSDTGITLSPGFCATVFADNIGHARHLVVSPSGVVYVNMWSGRYYNEAPVDVTKLCQ
jgi:hypothetical protein